MPSDNFPASLHPRRSTSHAKTDGSRNFWKIEKLAAHARDMWCRESARACKLAERVEDLDGKRRKLDDSLSKLAKDYERAKKELEQFRFLFNAETGQGQDLLARGGVGDDEVVA